MKVAVTGGTGLVGRFVVKDLRAAGHKVTLMSRPGYSLGDMPDLSGCNALVHCAFLHEPGRYRDGEGDDPQSFRQANLDGTVRLFEAAKASNLRRVIFLSSRAVYGDYPAGTRLTESTLPRPDTLYGTVKWQAEQALERMTGRGFTSASIRATGVYGPGPEHKWIGLFRDFLAGKTIAPRRAAEVHGDDLATAIRLLLGSVESGAFNVSDIILDRRDLLGRVARLTGATTDLPNNSTHPVSIMAGERLAALGWRPSGLAGLENALPDLIEAARLGRL